MKTTIDIPDKELLDAMQFTNAKTKREAVVTAITDFNRRQHIASLIKHTGTCEALISVETLQQQRQQGRVG